MTREQRIVGLHAPPDRLQLQTAGRIRPRERSVKEHRVSCGRDAGVKEHWLPIAVG